MEKKIIIKKIGSRIYLELMPIISYYGDAENLSEKLIVFLDSSEKNRNIESIGNFLYSQLGKKIKNIDIANKLAKILFNDYKKYLYF